MEHDCGGLDPQHAEFLRVVNELADSEITVPVRLKGEQGSFFIAGWIFRLQVNSSGEVALQMEKDEQRAILPLADLDCPAEHLRHLRCESQYELGALLMQQRAYIQRRYRGFMAQRSMQ
jgi:hypothetical protein